MAEVVVSGREQTAPRHNHRLTYKNMEQYIGACSDSKALLAEFATVKAQSKASASPYKYVCDWFKAQFPNYNKPVVFQNGKLTVAPVKKPDIIEYTQKLDKVG
jgi:hypothetical protein